MKKLKFLAVAAVFVFGCMLFAQTAQAQSVRGPVRTAVFTVKPAEGKDGYELKITMKYRFHLCAGDITLDCNRTAHEPLAYWYNGKRYTEAEIKGGCKFKTDKNDLYPNLTFTADVINEFTGRKAGSGRWFWVNLSDWGGNCLGDYGTGGFKYPTAGINGNVQDYIKGMIPSLKLTNIKPEDTPYTDDNIKKCISGKEEPKPAGDWVEINGVKWATKNLGASSPEDYGNYYTWDEAKKNCPAGWRLPTHEECNSLIESGSVEKQNGYEFAGGKLFFTRAGAYRNGEYAYKGTGLYWCSDWWDSYNAPWAFALVKTGYHSRADKLSVRLVKE